MGRETRHCVAPEVLQRAYGERVRTIEETLLFLLPTPLPAPEDCACKGRVCFGCGGRSFLIRPEDGLEYRKLLRRGFCVLAPNATLPAGICFNIKKSQTTKSYFGPNSQFLSTSTWCLLLSRIGDSLMFFLLKFTSIFIPFSNISHLQVSGPPLHIFIHSSKQEHKSKRRKIESKNLVKQNVFKENDNGKQFHFGTDGNNTIPSSQPILTMSTIHVTEEETVSLPENNHNDNGHSVYFFPESKGNFDVASSIDVSTENSTLSFGGNKRKHLRLYSWQRRKKYRKMLDNSEKNSMSSECSCCLMSRSLSELDLNTKIIRQSIFYSSVPSLSVFPRNHILITLKPNTSDAGVLMGHIFGLSEEFFSTSLLPSTEQSGISVQFNDLCSTLLRLLKVLIRNAHHCHFLNLLHKHCIVQISGCYSQNMKQTKTDQNFSEISFLNQQEVDGKYSSLKACSLSKTTHPGILFKNGSTDRSPYSDPAESYCRHDQVVSFIWAVSRSIIPIGLLGDSSTWRALRKNISEFVRLRRFEIFSLKQCMHGLKRTTFAFLPEETKQSGCFCCSNIKYKLFSETGCGRAHVCQINLANQFCRCWIYWYFSCMVVPIVSTCFYVTEREGGRNEVFYYPKPVWTKLIQETIAKLKEHNYRRLDLSIFRRITCRRSFGFSKVRFLPKEKGIRHLANLKAPSKVWFPVEKVPQKYLATLESSYLYQRKMISTKKMIVHFKSVNSALDDLNAIFKRVKREHPEYLGSSVFDYNDVYCILCPFLSKLKNGSVEIPKLYMVVSDVSKAFDSIDQDRLLNIMSDILKEDKYTFARYAQVFCSKKSLKALYRSVYVDNNGNRPITEFATLRQLCSSKGVHVNLGTNRNKKKDEIHSLLREHLKGNVIELDDAFYLQNVGIPQGSLLSSLLCSFYYGHMERNVILPFLQKIHNEPCRGVSTRGRSVRCKKTSESHSSKEAGCHSSSGTCNSDKERLCGNTDESGKPSYPNHVLLRFIDDFLFISTSEKLAISFFNRLKRGFREYNCYMNINKFGVNFDLGNQSEHFRNRIYTGPDGLSFLPWSGLLINCETLEIQADYTRYWAAHMSSTLTVTTRDEVSHHLKTKLCFYMKPKCHPLLFDSIMNSPAIVRLNVYQAFLVCAMKFHCYICTLSKTNLSPRSCAEIIRQSFRYTHILIKKRMYDTERYGNIRPLLRLKKAEVIWLGFSAYVRVLTKKQSRHVELLSLLSSMLESFGNMDNSSSPLKYAVDEIHSSMVWKIKY